MNILFLSRWFPYPPNNGSKLRIYNLLQGLAQRHAVTLISFAEQHELPLDKSTLKAICQEVHVIARKPFDPGSRQARLGFFSLTPRSVVDTFSSEMKQCIDQTLATKQYDLVIASQIDMAVYSRPFNHLPAIFEEVEVGTLFERFSQATSRWQRFRHSLTWAKHRCYLGTLLKNFQFCTVVSEQEKKLLTQTVNGKPEIQIVPNGVDLANYKAIHETVYPNTLIFTGSFTYHPNYEAMLWFTDKVLSLIQQQIPDVMLTITGNSGGKMLSNTKNVNQVGFVDDVRPFIARSWASVVPIHTGGGTRLKILEAMALKTPVIATSKGAEGIAAKPGKHILIADTPQDFADETIRLLKDAQLRMELAENGYQLIREKYNWPVIMPRFLKLLQKAANHQETPQLTKKHD